MEETEVTPEVTEEESSEASEVPAEVKKLRKENQRLRHEMRRSQIETKYGTEVADYLAESEAPLDKWEGLAEKLVKTFKTDPGKPAEDAGEETPGSEAPSPEEVQLGTLAASSASATATGKAKLDPAEAMDRMAKGIPVTLSEVEIEDEVIAFQQSR